MVLGSLLRPPTVGVDIGSSAVRAVSMRQGRSGWSLLAAGEAPVPDGCIQDGAVADPAMVSQTVQQLLDSLGMRRASISTLPNAWTASLWNTTPRLRARSAIAGTSCTVPISLFTHITVDTATVSSMA